MYSGKIAVPPGGGGKVCNNNNTKNISREYNLRCKRSKTRNRQLEMKKKN
jgi:hypothetical protein